MASTADNDRFRDIERRLADVEGNGARRLVQNATTFAGSQGRVIYALVNEASGVGSGDTSFSFDNAVAVVGTAPTGGTGTAQNQYAQTFANNDPILLFQSRDTGQWLTERGGTAGSQVTAFRLTADKSYADTEVLAKPVNEDGTVDSGADAVNLVDHEHQFWGLGPYTDGDSEAEVWPGYLAFGVRFTEDWDETGLPGFRIIAMEGPAQWVIVDLAEDVASDIAGVDYVASPDVSGRPFSNRRPRLEDGSPDPNFTAYDDFGIASGAKTGERWILKWEETEEHYVFWRRLGELIIKAKVNEGSGVAATDTTFDWDTGKKFDGTDADATSGTASNAFAYCFIDNEDLYLIHLNGVWVAIKAKRYIRVSAVVGSTVSAHTASFSAGTVKAIQGDLPELSGGNITVYNAAKIPLANSSTHEFRWNEETDHWETEPLVCHMVMGQATAGVTGGSFTIDNISLVCGSDPRSDPSSSSETLSVSNPFAWDIDNNGDVLAVKKADGTWIATQADCPA
jgi:hypothetical protein